MNQSNRNEIKDESRRRFISDFSKIVGSGVAASLLGGNAIATALAYEPDPASARKDGKVFSRDQMQLLRDICSLVLPSTDTPGAAEVDVHGFIDNQLAACFSVAVQDKTRKFLDFVEDSAVARHGQGFRQLTHEQQSQMLMDIEQVSGEFKQQNRRQFKQLKNLIVFGYYTSEVGASQELRYLAMPGGYTGSIPYKEDEGAWAN
jgi:hypothetical protein